ncbi:hypothetical protein QFC22_002005 [Naganishia vaughanmartiniae]|uniref:Uncharacterized protein n=1 Tax=Naganishia vaughanmartiniae TaxID=1424756 RepID=A0ACC2XHP1_9TREE|nr:hypothetical protein QFC22_002005 [Naganishia vaughanmartiniae]
MLERLPESEFTDSTQPTPSQETPLDAGTTQSPEALLRHAIIHSGPAFSLSSQTMEDLRWQDNQYSRTNAASRADARAMEDVLVTGEGYHIGSDHSDEEYGSREQTPASEIYREMGMESRAVQTELPDGSEPTSVLAAACMGDEEHNTSVGRTVVDYDGEPMEFEEDSRRAEEALLPAESTDSASAEPVVDATATLSTDNDIFDEHPGLKFTTAAYAPPRSEGAAGASGQSTTVANTAESSNAVSDDVLLMSSRSLLGFSQFRFSSPQPYARLQPPVRVRNPAPSITIFDAAESSSAGRALSSHESMVEDLIVPPGGSGYSGVPSYADGAEARGAAAIGAGRPNGMVFQPHSQAESQPDRVESPRSSPEPEAIMI